MQWSTSEINNARSSEDRICAEILLNFMDEHFLTQQVTENTRKDKNILDLILTNNEEWLHEITVEKTKFSDHDFVNASLANVFKGTKSDHSHFQPETPFDQLNFHKANWSNIKDELKVINWDEHLQTENTSVDNMISKLVNQIIEVSSKHTPKYKKKSDKNNSQIPRDRRALIRKRKRLNAKINILKYVKKCKSKEKIDKLAEEKVIIESKIAESIKREAEKREADILSKIKTNPKVLYSYAKKNSKVKCKIGPLLDKLGKLHSSEARMSDLLQDQYVQIFSDPSTTSEAYIPPTNENGPKLGDIDFTEQDIIDAIKLIPTNSATGPDKFPAIILKECKEELAKPLYTIWRKSLDTGQIPSIYLQQTIVPIFKKGSKSCPENYRPVSLTSHLIKVFERVLRAKIVEYIESNNFLSPDQHGFRSGHSCLTQLLTHFQLILDILETGANADVLYLDFAKAFDKVDHKRLLRKLKSIGISDKVLNWLNSFLSNREQTVIINGKKSRSEKVQSGVPQGTVLGPILFIIYINDITQVIRHSYIKIFADDSKLVKAIKSMSDRELLETDLTSVVKWAADNKMELNKLKFQLLQHGNKNELKVSYNIDEITKVDKNTEVKDLGVTMSEDLSYEKHVTNITNDAKRQAGWILRLIRSREAEIMLMLYKTYIRCKLEYASPLWSPATVKLISQLEAIQRSVTSKIAGMEGLDYWDRLRSLDLLSLQRRRERYQIIHMWKIYKGIIPNNLNLAFYETSRHGVKCRRPRYNQRSRYISTVKFNSFVSNGPALFNIVPTKIKEAKTVNSFKAKLQKFLQTFPDTPPIPNYTAQNRNSLLDWVKSSSDSSTRVQMADSTDEDEGAVQCGGASDGHAHDC